MKKKKVLIAVAWPYVNGDLHIGHLAGYLFPADIFARFNRFLGNETVMVSGSDCFGTPITIEADKRKMKPQEVVEDYHTKNLELFRTIDISYDLYTRTDTQNHKQVSQDVFLAMLKRGLIFKDKTEQYYSESETRFLPDRYVEGICPNCGFENARSDQCDKCGAVLNQGELINPKSKNTGAPVVLKLTEHYFADWPKLQPFLEKYIEERGASWRSWILEETRGWLRKGLKPRAITRDLDWGVEIPNDRIPDEMKIENANSKRIYVWFEAVLGYLSATIEWGDMNGKDWRDFWHDPEAKHYYFMGKDNLVFHTLFLPGELYGYDESIHLPDVPSINQFLNLESQKFSKSRGIIVDSKYIVEKYGRDPVCFYITFIMPENGDSNFSWEDFVEKNNSVLVGNLGNFINRTLTLGKNVSFSEPTAQDKALEEQIVSHMKNMRVALEKCEFKKSLECILALSDIGNKYFSKLEPWVLKKNNPEAFKKVIANCVSLVAALCIMVKPFMPAAHEAVSRMIGISVKTWPEDEKTFLKEIVKEIKVNNVEPLFKKIDESVIEEEKSKLNLPKTDSK